MTTDIASGTRYKNFTYTKVTPVEELSCTLYELEHECGAQIVHIGCEDLENSFCIGLKTWPDSSDGAPHILEHTVLCGSEKFPVKDPFFAMTRRSLNTFMNAFTGADFTCYPASSCNEKDFYNLFEVYCDAVFFPKLQHLSFLQEGHRFEFQKPSDPSTPLLYQGIVYNEMKGALSSPDSRMWNALHKALYPDLTYAFNSGGDPKDIPNLTYEGLKEFHKTYYHPSRTVFYFYGNLPLEKHLDALQENVLYQTEKMDPLPVLPKQKRFTKPIEVTENYPTHDKETQKQTMGVFSWLTCTPTDIEDSLALMLLDDILTDHDASPLKHAILNSGLCSACDGHLDYEMSEIPYVLVCKGCDPDDIPKLKSLIFETLENIAKQGIDPELAKSALHQSEFERLEIGGGGLPFGLSLYFRSAALKAYGGKPESGLKFFSAFESLQKKIEDPTYLSGLIKHYFLKNTHFVQLTLKPDPNLAALESKQEREKLDKIRAGLTENEVEKIVHTADQLKTFQLQNEAQSLDCLPKVEVKDVPEDSIDYPLSETNGIYHHPVFTNHIVYISLVQDLCDLSVEELPYAQLYTSILTELGADGKSYLETLENCQAYIGGIQASIQLHPQAKAPDILKPALVLKGKALLRNREKLIDQMKAFVYDPRVDEKERIKELVLQIYTYMQQRLNQSSMGFATGLATYHLSRIGEINRHCQGLQYFKFIENLAQNINQLLPNLLQKFESLKHRLFHMNNPEVVVACDEKSFSPKSFHFKTSPERAFTPFSLDPKRETPATCAYTISSPVAFTAMGLKTIDSSDERSAHISLASELFDNLILHPKIREQGGAYGSGSSYNPTTGSFYFYGFRDPNLSSTIETFPLAPKIIASGDFSEQDLDEAKLGLIQSLDAPIYPGSRAMCAYAWQRGNKTQSYRQAYRSSILKATKEDIVKSAKLIDTSKNAIASFGPKTLFEKENKKLRNPLHIFSL